MFGKSSCTVDVDCHCPFISKIVVFAHSVFIFINDVCRYHCFQIQALLILSIDDICLRIMVVIM